MDTKAWIEVVFFAIETVTCIAAMAAMAVGRWSTHRAYVMVAWLLPLGQLVTLALLIHTLLWDGNALWPCVVVLVTGIACAVGDVALLRGVDVALQKRLAEEEAALLEEQVQLQAQYYESMAEEQAKAQRMQLAFSKRLEQVRRAVEHLDAESAHSAVQAAGTALQPAAPSYCAHPVVDALLQRRAQDLERLGAEFSCRVSLPAEIPLDDALLCAAFSNMLDNAQRACANLPAGHRWIHLRALASRGEFVVRVENPRSTVLSPRRRSSPLSSHGWGLDILRCIAADHNGDLVLHEEDGVFCTQLVLHTGRPQSAGKN